MYASDLQAEKRWCTCKFEAYSSFEECMCSFNIVYLLSYTNKSFRNEDFFFLISESKDINFV